MLLPDTMVQVYPGEARPFLATTKHYKEYYHSFCYLLLWYIYNLEKQDHVWQQLNTIKSTIIHAVTCCYGTGITWSNKTMSGND